MLLPSRLEYVALASIYAILICTLLQKQIGRVIRRRAFWLSGLVFYCLWILLEQHALTNGWWVFNPNKIIGLSLLGIPLEEYFAFALIHLSTVALLEAFIQDDVD